MPSVTLELPLPPSANTYWKHSRNGVYVSPQAMEFRDKVAIATIGYDMLSGELRVTAHCYICDTRRDLDNGIKQLLDALQGRIFEDDNAVVEIHMYRHKAATRKVSKVIVTIEEL